MKRLYYIPIVLQILCTTTTFILADDSKMSNEYIYENCFNKLYEIENILQHSRVVQVITNYEERCTSDSIVYNNTKCTKKYVVRLSNGLECIFVQQDLDQIRGVHCDLIAYDISKFLKIGHILPIVWRDDVVINGEKVRGTLQLKPSIAETKGLKLRDIIKKRLITSQKELDNYRILNFLLGLWDISVEEIHIDNNTGCLIHDNFDNMLIPQQLSTYGDIPFILFNHFYDFQIPDYIKQMEGMVATYKRQVEKIKDDNKKQRNKVRQDLLKTKREEERKKQQFEHQQQKMIDAQKKMLEKQQKAFEAQQKALEAQQKAFEKQQQMMSPQIPNQYGITPQQQIGMPPQVNLQPQPYNTYVLDQIDQQLKMLDDMDEKENFEAKEPFPFEMATHLNDEEKYRIIYHYQCIPPSLPHKYIIYDRNYWLQVDNKEQVEIAKFMLYPSQVSSNIIETLERLSSTGLWNIFLSRMYKRRHDDQIKQYIEIVKPIIEGINERRLMLISQFKPKGEEDI